tara:strand:+ start:2236 stop:3678 length:1443 start_codon:yes stop_codon:yes gene_type:complete
MATFYSKERAKYGNVTGQIIAWPVNYEGAPDAGANKKLLPAGYLKCDGTKYYAVDYPQLAAICGTGTACKFIRKNLDGSDIDIVTESQFMVPDLGSKYAEPTSGANAGVYNSIRKNNNAATPQEISRSGIGIEAESAIGTNVTITYSGQINVPSQEIPVRGRPSWSYAGTTHRTDSEGVEDNAIHPHMHYSTTTRARNYTKETTNNDEMLNGRCGFKNASTVNLQDWLDNTKYGNSSSNPPGSAQKVCIALDNWNPNAGTGDDGSPIDQSGWGYVRGFYGGCIGGSSSIYRVGGGANFEFGCLSNQSWTAQRTDPMGTPENVPANITARQAWLCTSWGPGGMGDLTVTVPTTYTTGANFVPLDWNGNSLADPGYVSDPAARTAVVPLQANQDRKIDRATPDIENETFETVDLPRSSGVDPTVHNHRIDLDKGDHSYKVKTKSIAIAPDNLSTTMTIGADASASIDSATAPFIVMEYLIKV